MEDRTTTTTTTTTETVTCNVGYIKSLPGILRLLELVLGLLCWALISSTYIAIISSAHRFVMFVTVTSWVLTLILLIIYLSGLHVTACSAAPWSIIEFIFNAFWALFYFIAACVSAAHAYRMPVLIAGIIFAFFVAVIYIIHAFISFRDWRGNITVTVRSTTTTTEISN